MSKCDINLNINEHKHLIGIYDIVTKVRFKWFKLIGIRFLLMETKFDGGKYLKRQRADKYVFNEVTATTTITAT